MNYLFHLYLSEADPLARLGNLAGDFVKGRLDDRWHPAIARGLALHRRIDAFAHTQAAFQASRQRLDPALGLYRGVLVDIFYDHFLARHWPYRGGRSLPRFAAAIYADLQRFLPLLPAGLQRIAPHMIAHDWLVSYRDQAVVTLVLKRMAGRGRHSRLLAGVGELEQHYAGLEGDFGEFLASAEAWLAKSEGIMLYKSVDGHRTRKGEQS